MTRFERRLLGSLLLIIGFTLFAIATADLWWRLLFIILALWFIKKGFGYLHIATSGFSRSYYRDNRYDDNDDE